MLLNALSTSREIVDIRWMYVCIESGGIVEKHPPSSVGMKSTSASALARLTSPDAARAFSCPAWRLLFTIWLRRVMSTLSRTLQRTQHEVTRSVLMCLSDMMPLHDVGFNSTGQLPPREPKMRPRPPLSCDWIWEETLNFLTATGKPSFALENLCTLLRMSNMDDTFGTRYAHRHFNKCCHLRGLGMGED